MGSGVPNHLWARCESEPLMSSIAEVRHHISVVKDTAKITNAMYLISSAKMKKAMRMHDQNLIYLKIRLLSSGDRT